jgi:two-component system sensor histidine kinase KdpD
MHLLEAFASQAALSIERDRLESEAQKAQLNVDTEKSRNALLSSVSHDLRTPLAAISGAATSLRCDADRLSPAAKQELVDSIIDESHRMSRLISNLLEMTKLESGKVQIKKEFCPIEEIVGSALARLEQTLKSRPIKISLPPDLPLAPIDILLIEQVFINLLENAAKYTPDGSPIEISATSSSKEISVVVADRGPGIAQGEEKKVFDKFHRAHNHNKVAGAGLGLAICRAVIEAHGGGIVAENRPGGGALFRFSLPLGSAGVGSK